MSVELRDVYADLGSHGHGSVNVLFRLLQERTPAQSISHREMPTFEEHKAFVESVPYEAWYMIHSPDGIVGSTYLSKQREIGIFIFKACQGKGYGSAAVEMLMALHPGVAYANVNPANTVSIDMFRRLGFSLIQLTFKR